MPERHSTPRAGGGGSSLPVPVRGPVTRAGSAPSPSSATSTSTMASSDTRLKMQLDDCERRRKNLVIQSQKVTRENEALQRKYKRLSSEHETLSKTFAVMKEEHEQLKRVSEGVYKEYEKLQQRFNAETGAMHKAMEKATDWYKQNRALKRQSAIMYQKFLQVSPDIISELENTPSISEKEEDELEDLRRSMRDLTSDNARLQVEANAARLQEFEAQEELIEMSSRLEMEKAARLRVETELTDLKQRTVTLATLASLEAEELAALRERLEKEKETATQMRKEADQAKKERNVLAHQSSLLLADLTADERITTFLLDIERLKAKLEDETNKNNLVVQELQNKIFELQSENRIEALEEKLKLAETELECEHQRRMFGERRIEELETKIQDLEEGAKRGPPAPPPPPLPPPPPAFSDNPPPVNQMASMLGLRNTPQPLERNIKKTPTLQSGAIDEIIDQIKGGRFQLKATERNQWRQEEKPAAVQEMLQILGTMKRGAKRTLPEMQ